MHELSVTENILEIVQRHAQQAEAKRVMRIRLVIGELSSIVDDSVQFYFDFLSQNTLAAGAKLEFERVPTKVTCGACGHTWQPPTADWTCPQCEQLQARVIAGQEFYVDSIEVE
jgi:hydrogenase nickel incorporation protein HypA/HybF